MKVSRYLCINLDVLYPSGNPISLGYKPSKNLQNKKQAMGKQQRIPKTRRMGRSVRWVAIVSITLPLFILGWVALLELAQKKIEREVRENVTFTLLLAEESTDSTAQALMQKLSQEVYVKDARYISPQEAAQELEQEIGENPEEVLGYNPLQPSIEIHLHARYAHPDSLAKVDQWVGKWNGVDSFSYRSDMLHAMDLHLGKLFFFLLMISAVLLFVAIIQINNTTHLVIYSRRFLIRSMTLLGAKPFFIKKPFIRYAMANGIVAGILADLLILGTFSVLFSGDLSTILSFFEPMHLLAVALALPLAGLLVCMITSFFSTDKYIRMTGSKIILS